MRDWRFIAARANGDGTETFLAWDLPISNPQVRTELSGPDRIWGTIDWEVAGLKDPDTGEPILVPWSTILYFEQRGQIECGTILTNLDLGDDGQLRLDSAGFTSYPQGQVYDDERSLNNFDPLSVVRHIWTHLQGKANGNLGVEVSDNTSPIRVGEANDEGEAQPYKLSYKNTFNLGSEIDRLANETPFDYRMRHVWNGETVDHLLDMEYPTIAQRRRNDLRFVVGENIHEIPPMTYDGDEYASEVHVIGAGEGTAQIRGISRRSGETRLRRAIAIGEPDIRHKSRADAIARRELRMRGGEVDIEDFHIIDHPNAPLGGLTVGEEVLVQTEEGWLDRKNIWYRTLAITLQPESGTAIIEGLRSEKVRYQ